jgi:hypothetical protein
MATVSFPAAGSKHRNCDTDVSLFDEIILYLGPKSCIHALSSQWTGLLLHKLRPK